MQKARRHPSEERLRLLVSTRFQVLFHSPPGVLFTFPSRYLSTIGHRRVFSLRRWSARIHTRFHVSGTTWERIPGPGSAFTYGPITLFGGTFQNLLLADFSTRGDTRSSGFFPQHRQCNARAAYTLLGLDCSLSARRYWGNRVLFLFLRVLRCFSSPGLPLQTYVFSKEILRD